MCLVDSTGNSFLNFPQATQHLSDTIIAFTGAHHIIGLREGGLHTKHGAVDIHFSHSSALDGPNLAITPAANKVCNGHQFSSDATAPLLDPQLAPQAQQTTQR